VGQLGLQRTADHHAGEQGQLQDTAHAVGHQHKETQTDIPIGRYGIDGCPCPDKSRCYDM